MDGQTVETLDGDFIHVFNTLFSEYNAQFGLAYDHSGTRSTSYLLQEGRRPKTFPVENGALNCLLPFWFMRTRLQEGLPMIAVKDGSVKIHITLRPFAECVRQMRGTRDTCDSTPLSTVFQFTYPTCKWFYDPATAVGYWDITPKFIITIPAGNNKYTWDGSQWSSTYPGNFITPTSFIWNGLTWTTTPPPFDLEYVEGGQTYIWNSILQAWNPPNLYDDGTPTFPLTYGNNTWTSAESPAGVAPPMPKSVQLLTYGAVVDGELRTRMLRNPFDLLHREVQTFSFDEPLKYAVGWNGTDNRIRIQLPLEANHPVEEIIWFVRRKDVKNNNEWTNYSSAVEADWTPAKAAQPLLQTAELQVNGQSICKADEQYYRQRIAAAHRGGFAAYSRFIYGYSFAEHPAEHQPSGSLNASRVDSLRLILEVAAPQDGTWEVKVFCLALNWTRFENGLSSPMYMD